jgi:hypothetical protein
VRSPGFGRPARRAGAANPVSTSVMCFILAGNKIGLVGGNADQVFVAQAT